VISEPRSSASSDPPQRSPLRLLVTGGSGVLGRALQPLAAAAGHEVTMPARAFGATLHVADAGRALVSALTLPSGIYNVCRDGERVSTERFTRAAGWHPQQ